MHEILRKMDRPYLRGTAGVHKNITGGVRDYFPPTLAAGKAPETKASEFLEAN